MESKTTVAHSASSSAQPEALSPTTCANDALFVVPNFRIQLGNGKRPPFASVLALTPGEVIAFKPRRCIHVFRGEDGEYEYDDGVLAVKDKCAHISQGVVWPELWKALRTEPKAWSKLFHPKPGFKPYTAIKNWHEDAVPVGVTEPSDCTCVALIILRNWNNWESKKLSWMERLVALTIVLAKTQPDAVKILQSTVRQRAELNKLEKYCRKLGLQAGTRTEFESPFRELCSLLAEALQIEES